MTAFVDIDDFLPEAIKWAPNASDPVALKAIRQSAREICTAARNWVEPAQIAISHPRMQPTCPVQDADILEIRHAFLDDWQLEPVTLQWINDAYPRWPFDLDHGTPRYITQLQPNTLTVYPFATGTLFLQMVLVPSRRATSLPAFLMDGALAELLSDGAASFLLTEPSSSNPQLGLAKKQAFEAALTTLKINALRGQQRAPLRTKGAYF